MATSRFLTRDPIGYVGSVNLYAYCGNEPLQSHDIAGLFGFWGYCEGDRKFRALFALCCEQYNGRFWFKYWNSLRTNCEYKNIFCNLGTSCLAGLLTAIIADIVNTFFPVAALIGECIAGIINAILGDIASRYCNLLP